MDRTIEQYKNFKELSDNVHEIINQVIEKGDDALIECTRKFDGVTLEKKEIEIKKEEWKGLIKQIDEDLYNAISGAFENINTYSKNQLKLYKDSKYSKEGIEITDKFIPVEKVGLYVPGGRFSYPSSVLMSAVPARVAGVDEIFMVTPPGKLTPSVLAAAEIAGVDGIFRVGGVQAIAALATGSSRIPKVDKIVGPGNDYVQCAKQILSSVVGIDIMAGPSEVVIIADGFQNPEFIKADLLAQAEHSDNAAGILISESGDIMEKVSFNDNEKIKERIKKIKVDNIIQAADVSNTIAPEHLQIMVKKEKEREIQKKIKNAGAVFINKNTPVAVGDYWAGPSHTLPTGGAAKYQEGLNVRNFLKRVSFIECTKSGITKAAPYVAKLAEAEGMIYHKESILKRLKNEKK
ncbi:MAG: histidinol dehydrogenase [Elusimicrobiota bacterium]